MRKNIFLKCMVKYVWLLFIEVGLAMIVSYTMVKGNKIISVVIDEMLAGKEVVFGSFMLQFLAFVIIGALSAFTQSITTSRYALLICTKYKDLVVEKLYRIEYSYFNSNYVATLLNKVIGDLGEISGFLESVLPEILNSVIALIIYSVYIGQLSLKLLVLILISYPLIFFIAGILVKKISSLQVVYRQKTDKMAEIAQDAVNGILVVRSFGIEHVFQEKMHQAAGDLVENEEKRTRITNAALIIRKVIQWLPNIISAVYAVYLVSMGEISLGELVAFILILNEFVEAFIGLPFCMVDASAGLVSIKRIEEILENRDECGGIETIPLDTKIAISVDDVNFEYVENSSVLRKLCFEVKKGQNVAIVGESGGGKSTIFRILCRFYNKTSGQYQLLGRDSEEWDIKALREQIALVSQNVFLFPTTIEKNVSYGKSDATHEEIVNACKKAEIHDFIMTLPQGYQTMVGERGAILSGGQKQRISIARAILKNAPILLLDEPTSALDVETENCIQKAIKAAMSDRTCITIAHRLSTIMDADKIMVLKRGNIVESGTHEELMALGREYAVMYREGADYGKL
ncbi:MAG: ABC transporter ATP-binding protein [Lachnospiraceae bacterium]|nr:ABC transporter ATP-binding protein [Lachnospiraceae bacterium]